MHNYYTFSAGVYYKFCAVLLPSVSLLWRKAAAAGSDAERLSWQQAYLQWWCSCAGVSSGWLSSVDRQLHDFNSNVGTARLDDVQEFWQWAQRRLLCIQVLYQAPWCMLAGGVFFGAVRSGWLLLFSLRWLGLSARLANFSLVAEAAGNDSGALCSVKGIPGDGFMGTILSWHVFT
jgi:hypothetical protein